ncbi:MAG TPA: ATP-binding protein [Candidatus Binatia bacterium]|nr:ATP-binding protein [Candidatus Binatia bacterium]
MATSAYRDLLDEGTVDPVLLQRVRLGIRTLIVATVILAAGEVIIRSPLEVTLLAVQSSCLLSLFILLWAVRQGVGRRGAIALGVAAMAVAAATSLSAAAVTGNWATPRFVFVAISMGAASLIPWGRATQTLVVAMLGLAYAATIAWIGHPTSGARPRELLELAVVLSVSIYIADEFARYRRLVEAERMQRRRREDELEEQRAFLRQVIDINPHLIFARDRDGRFTLVNRATAEVYGATVEELIGKRDDDFNPNREQVERFQRDDLAVMNSRRERLIAEELVADIGGRQRWLRTIKRPIISADGHVEQVLGVATEITEQRRALAELEEAAQVGSRLARVGQEIIAGINTAELLPRLCRATTEALGCQFAQVWLLQPEDDAFVPVAEYGGDPEQWEATRVLRVPRSLLGHLISQNGERPLVMVTPGESSGVMPALGRLTPNIPTVMNIVLRRGGEISGSLSVGFLPTQLPVTERHQRIARGIGQLGSVAIENARLLDQLNRANQLKTEFMATMSHELRTPLNVILGYTGLMLDGEMGETTARQTESLQCVNDHAHQLLDLINATLDVSRLESGEVPLDLQDVGLDDLIAAVESRTVELRRKPNVRFVSDLPRERVMLHTDVGKLKVVLSNLISNALKFTTAGTVGLLVTADDDCVEFAVSDTGIGIDPAARAHIFEPFRQADSSIGAQYGGVGLGLYIVTRLVAALRGTITVQSAVGQGSTFCVRVPRWMDSRRSAAAT